MTIKKQKSVQCRLIQLKHKKALTQVILHDLRPYKL
ncbi:MAG: hypothetical protein ACJAS1_006900, partial [Oleiphilaceae bacterium]